MFEENIHTYLWLGWFRFGKVSGIGAKIIANGLALDCPQCSGGRYAEYEIEGAAVRMKLPGDCL
jgi:hypothetical protein